MASAAYYDDKAQVEHNDPKLDTEYHDAYDLFLNFTIVGNADAYQFFRGASGHQHWKQRFRKVSSSISHSLNTY